MRIYCSNLIIGILLSFLFLFTESYAEEAVGKGIILYREARFNDAIAELDSVLESAPTIAKAYLYRGNVYFMKEDFISAIQDYSKALRINPEYALAYYNRAVAYYSIQDYSMAWEDVHRARKLGYMLHVDFIEQLKEDSGRNE